MHDDSEVMIACFNEKACKHGVNEDGLENKNCKDKYGGIMCAHCEEGFWKPRGTFVCYTCEYQSLGFFICLGLVTLFLLAMIYRMQLRNFPNPKNEILAVWRIWLNQFHFLYILNTLSDSQYNLGAYRTLKKAMDMLNLFMNPVSSIVAQDCMGMTMEDQTDNFYKQVYMMVALPPGILLFNTLFWFIGTKIAKATGDKAKKSPLNRARLFNRISILSGIMLFFVYPNIIEILL